MIVKMKFLSITGPKNDIDRVTDLYFSKYEIQLENALSELKTVDNLQPFIEINPYKDALEKANQFVGYLSDKESLPEVPLSMEELFQTIRTANNNYMDLKEKEQHLKEEQEALRDKLKVIEPFSGLECNIHDVMQYHFIKFRFGRVALNYYHKVEKYVSEDLNVIFLEGGRDTSYVYGVYFSSRSDSERIDAILKSLHFERIFLPDEYDTTPTDACRTLEKSIHSIEKKIRHIDEEIAEILSKDSAKLVSAQKRLQVLAKNFDVRKLAACVEDKHDNFFILCGWMSEADISSFLEDVKHDPNLFVVVEDDHETYFGEPPTKLKNPKIFKPFEMFIHMYGLPAHNEMDPTIFLALTYTFIFGAMFGDVGQGLCLAIGGGLLYKFKKIDLAGVISLAGIFSTFFGFMFGSVFGFENIIEAKWLHPISAMTSLPFVGQLNTVFIVAIAFGMGIILLSMIFQIINSLRAHDLENAWFSPNGVAGLIFYGSVVLAIVLFMTGHKMPANILLAVLFGVPVLMMVFKEPLAKKLEKRTGKTEGGKVMFFVQAFFELFETMLSYFSNTLSFVRIGAFAVSHAAMMEVVLMLGGATQNSSPNWIVIVAGNIFVCLMEGLVVGIQVLRLEYYEMFSRFYKGSGREFKPYNQKNV